MDGHEYCSLFLTSNNTIHTEACKRQHAFAHIQYIQDQSLLQAWKLLKVISSYVDIPLAFSHLFFYTLEDFMGQHLLCSGSVCDVL